MLLQTIFSYALTLGFVKRTKGYIKDVNLLILGFRCYQQYLEGLNFGGNEVSPILRKKIKVKFEDSVITISLHS